MIRMTLSGSALLLLMRAKLNRAEYTAESLKIAFRVWIVARIKTIRAGKLGIGKGRCWQVAFYGRSEMSKCRWIGLARIVCTLLLLIWAFHQVGAEFWGTFLRGDLRLGWVAVEIGLGFLSVLGWATRWFLLLREIEIAVSF